MDRNTILALVLSFGLVVSIYYIYAPQMDRSQKKKEVKDRSELSKLEEKKKQGSEKVTGSNSISEESSLFSIKGYGNNDIEVKDFEVETSIFKIRFSTLGGGIKSLKLKKYQDEEGNLVDAVFKSGQRGRGGRKRNKDNIITLGTRFGGSEGLGFEVYRYGVYEKEGGDFLLVRGNLEEGNLEEGKLKFYGEEIKRNEGRLIQKYQKEGEEDSFGEGMRVILFVCEYERLGVRFEVLKIYTLRGEDYLIDIDTVIKNGFEGELRIEEGVYMEWGPGLGPYYEKEEGSQYDEVQTTAYLKMNEEGGVEEEIIEGNVKDLEGFKWVSLDSRYLLVSMIGDWTVNEYGKKEWGSGRYFGKIDQGELEESEGIFGKSLEKREWKKERIGIWYTGLDLKEGGEEVLHSSVFIGPKTRSILDQEEYEAFELIRVRDRSWIPLIKPIEWGIEWLLFTSYGWVRNYGLGIIVVTIILKLMLYPLSKKTLHSSKKMQELGPKMKEIEKKYKKNVQEKQKAMMALYKKEKVNPLGGCLPILLQLPVFYALWNVLPSLLELKNANFLWIKDLSSPDTVMELNLILTDKLNLLPILMTLTSLLQMKLMPQPMMSGGLDEKAQMAKNMQYMMPVIFLFVFWTMPSGLVLYWTMQNILQILEQWYHGLRKGKKGKSVDGVQDKIGREEKWIKKKKS